MLAGEPECVCDSRGLCFFGDFGLCFFDAFGDDCSAFVALLLEAFDGEGVLSCADLNEGSLDSECLLALGGGDSALCWIGLVVWCVEGLAWGDGVCSEGGLAGGDEGGFGTSGKGRLDGRGVGGLEVGDVDTVVLRNAGAASIALSASTGSGRIE